MKEKIVAIAALAAVVAIVVLSVPSQETEADATNPFTVVDGSDYASFNDAITNVPDNGTIEVNTSTSIAGTTINATKAFTLDLNGNTITTSGTLIVGSGTTLTIESSVEGGAILASGATIINLNGGTLNILSGTIDRAEGNTSTNVTAVLFTSGTLTIGTQGSDVGPHLAKIQPKGKDVTAYSGIVEGALYNTFGDGSVLQCYFENSPNSRIPENMVTTYDENTGYWTVQPYTIGSATGAQASITHADGTVTYYSSAFYAASEMDEGETLTLLADYVGDGALTFPIHYGTLDLGKYSISKTWSTGAAVATEHSQNDRNPDPTKPFVITGEAYATITGPTSVELSAGTSNNRLLFSLQGDVSLVSSTGDECIDIGTGSYLVYSESILKYVTGTAFKATVDGVELIYGVAGSAIRDSDDAYALMLNDCNEGINLVPDDGRMWTLDLGGHTVSSSTTNGTIDIGVSDAKVTICHGTVEGTYNGIFIGIPPGNGTVYNNIEVIIEDVVIEVTGDYADDINNITYGINTNGISTGIEVTLKNSTVECTNGMGIYFPADGALTLEDSKVKGLSGIELRRGTLEISGESSVEAYSKTYSVSGNSGGPNMTGAAIAVIPYGSTEPSVIGVSISGNGTFTGPVAFAVDNALDVDNLSYDISVSGGKFTSTGNDVSGQAYSAIEIEAGEISERFISNGTFSSDVSQYCVDDYVTVDDGNGNYVAQHGYTVTYIVDGVETIERVPFEHAASNVPDFPTADAGYGYVWMTGDSQWLDTALIIKDIKVTATLVIADIVVEIVYGTDDDGQTMFTAVPSSSVAVDYGYMWVYEGQPGLIIDTSGYITNLGVGAYYVLVTGYDANDVFGYAYAMFTYRMPTPEDPDEQVPTYDIVQSGQELDMAIKGTEILITSSGTHSDVDIQLGFTDSEYVHVADIQLTADVTGGDIVLKVTPTDGSDVAKENASSSEYLDDTVSVDVVIDTKVTSYDMIIKIPIPTTSGIQYLSGAVAFYTDEHGVTTPVECYIVGTEGKGSEVWIYTDHNTQYTVVPMSYSESVYSDTLPSTPQEPEEPDNPGVINPPIIDDDDDYVPPIYVPSDTSSSDDDTVKIVACAAAAVVAAIMAAFLILGHRRE